jgi:outer membrane protein OmpA-like peptidoglycan-associated protein
MTTYADSGKWRIPLSVGYPVKKEKPTQKSERAPEKDSYLVTFNATKAIPITLLRGKLSDEKNNLPQSAEITVTDNVSGDIMGIYHPDETSGHYNLLLAPGKNNNVTFDASGYLFHSENIDLTGEPSLYKVVEPTVMKPFMENSREILNNVFFASKSTTFQPSSLPELQKLHLFLKNNPGCRIELGCAGMAVDDSENGRLAGARARAVAGYLLDKGIEKERVVTHAYAAKKKHRKKRAPTIALANTEKIEIKITDIK